jgi:uncharacterized protein with PQ loop repeat
VPFVIVTTLGAIGTTLGVIRAWPQVRGIVCRRETAGVSTQTWALTLLNNASWLTLGLVITALPIIISNLLSALGCVAVLVAVELGQPRRQLAFKAGVVLAGAAVVGLASLGGAAALTVLATMLAVSMFIPQLVLVLRSGAAGVSASTWLVTALSSAVWILYAFALGRPSIAACHIVTMPASLVIAYRASRRPADGRADTSVAAAPSSGRRTPVIAR